MAVSSSAIVNAARAAVSGTSFGSSRLAAISSAQCKNGCRVGALGARAFATAARITATAMASAKGRQSCAAGFARIDAGIAAAPAAVSTVLATRASHAKTDDDLSYEEFNKKYLAFFEHADELFEVQRGLNNAFSYDVVPSAEVCEAALRACRRVSDYATAVRVLHGLKDKCPQESDYKLYLKALAPVCNELGIETAEDLGFSGRTVEPI